MFCNNISSYATNTSTADGLALYQLYIYAGVPAAFTNVICIIVFATKRQLFNKYSLFATLATGDLLSGLGMLLAGIFRTRLILNNDYNKRTSFECLLNPWPHFYIVGGHISAFAMLIMGIERVLAVYKPISYKTHVTPRLRIAVIGQCLLVALISLLIGYLCSYLNREVECEVATCTTLNTTGRLYSTYNYFIVIIFPIVAFVLNVLTYIGAKRSVSSSQMQLELRKILLTLAISICSVAFIAVPNILLWGYKRYWNPVFMPYLFITFCCYSTINLFVYVAMKEDFRRHLLFLLSLGFYKNVAAYDNNKAEMHLMQVRPSDALLPGKEMNHSMASTSPCSSIPTPISLAQF